MQPTQFPEDISYKISVDAFYVVSVYYSTVAQKSPTLACYNFDTCKWILNIFGRNITN